MKKSNSAYNIIKHVVPPVAAVAVLIGVWELLSVSGAIPSFMLPSPGKVAKAFVTDFGTLCYHGATTLYEAFLGLTIGIVLSFLIATVMDAIPIVRRALYPIMVTSQTIPSIAIAPLLILWLGYGVMPKIVLIVITTFFPITVSLIDGFAAADPDAMNLMKSMGGNAYDRYRHIKLPGSLGYFFSGLKISVSYSIVGAVISEWLGGTRGLGVYMTRTRKNFAYDRMFAVILFIALVSLLLIGIVALIKWWVMPWDRKQQKKGDTNEKDN